MVDIDALFKKCYELTEQKAQEASSDSSKAIPEKAESLSNKQEISVTYNMNQSKFLGKIVSNTESAKPQT